MMRNTTFNQPTMFEAEYVDLLSRILDTGKDAQNRTEYRTLKLFGNNGLSHNCSPKLMTSPHSEYQYMVTTAPILVGRPIKFDIAWYETMMFLQGITDTTYLEDRGVSIWKGNTTREFLDNRGLTHLREKNLGKGYGYQWRRWNDSFDQLQSVLDQMMENPFSRRHVVSAWNPVQNKEAALDPCHILFQFNVEQGESDEYFVDIQFYMRSSDVVFGLPFNMLSYYLILNLVCGYLSATTNSSYLPRNIFYTSGDAHIYENQIEFATNYIWNQAFYESALDDDDDDIHTTPKFSLISMRRSDGSLTSRYSPAEGGEMNTSFDEYLRCVEQFIGNNASNLLEYDPLPKLETKQPKMAVG